LGEIGAMIRLEPGACDMENKILFYLQSKLQQKPNFKTCIMLSGDIFSNSVPLEGFQFAINISVSGSKKQLKFSLFDIKFTTAAYQIQNDGIAQLHILRMLSFFNDSNFQLVNASNHSLLETKSTFEVYNFVADLLSHISNTQYSKMSLHQELFVGPHIELSPLQRHIEVQSIVNEVNLFNSDIIDSRVLLFCKTNNRFKNLQAKFGVYNIDKQSIFLSLILDCSEEVLVLIEKQLQQHGFNSNISVCTPFIGEILFFLEPQIGYDIELILNKIIRTIF
jgi:hypothetical protein